MAKRDQIQQAQNNLNHKINFVPIFLPCSEGSKDVSFVS